MTAFAFLFIFLAIGAPMLAIGLLIGNEFAPSDLPEGHEHCDTCRRSLAHLSEPHRVGAPRGPFNKSTTRRGD